MKAGVRGRDERGALDEVASLVRHAQRLVDGEVVQRLRERVAMRVGGEIPGDVLDQLARVGAHGAGEQDRGQIGSAAPE